MTREDVENALFILHDIDSLEIAKDIFENHISYELGEAVIDNMECLVNWFNTGKDKSKQ